jgi:hypothetical protein
MAWNIILPCLLLVFFAALVWGIVRMVRLKQVDPWAIVGMLAFGALMQWRMQVRREGRHPPGIPQQEAAPLRESRQIGGIRSRPVGGGIRVNDDRFEPDDAVPLRDSRRP